MQSFYIKLIDDFLALGLAELVLDDDIGSCREKIAVDCHTVQSTEIEVFPAEDNGGGWFEYAGVLEEEELLEDD